MKIAARIYLTAFVSLLAFTLGGGGGARAQALAGVAPSPATPVSSAVQPAPGPVANSSSDPARPSAVATPPQVKEVIDSFKAPSSAHNEDKSKDKGSKNKKADKAEHEEEAEGKVDMPAADPKVPSSIKKTVKTLTDSTDDVTLDNLNSAREAIVKLDVLLEIEKRLNDLTKLRKDRQEKLDEFAGAIPSTAIPAPSLPPPALVQQPASLIDPSPASASISPVAMSPSGPEIVRVSGVSGRYVAQVKDGDATRTVRSGDKLSDGSEVESISRDGVTVIGFDKKRKTIQVKDINTVFGGR